MPNPFAFKGVPSLKKEFGGSVSEVCFPCYIPGGILATSEEAEDVVHRYETGASSYIPKPVTFEGMVEIIKKIGFYWFDIVRLPPGK
jgi:hypothetical protein